MNGDGGGRTGWLDGSDRGRAPFIPLRVLHDNEAATLPPSPASFPCVLAFVYVCVCVCEYTHACPSPGGDKWLPRSRASFSFAGKNTVVPSGQGRFRLSTARFFRARKISPTRRSALVHANGSSFAIYHGSMGETYAPLLIRERMITISIIEIVVIARRYFCLQSVKLRKHRVFCLRAYTCKVYTMNVLS